MINIAGLATFVIIGSFSPGPNNIVSMRNAIADGVKSLRKFLTGLGLGFTLMMILSSTFNRLLFTRYPGVEIYMKYFGFVYLSYLAFKIYKSTFGNGIKSTNDFKTGFIMQFANIKVVMYGIVIFSSFINPSLISVIELVGISVLLALTAISSCITWGLFGELINKVLSGNAKLLNTVMALLLFGVAISIILY